jgi:carbamoyl-phosphate synthase large subunit
MSDAKRVLVSGAGTGASNNLVRSLRAGDPSMVIVGYHDDRFALKKSAANRNYLLPPSRDPGFADALRSLVDRERIHLVVPNDDGAVKAVSEARDGLPCRVFLPRKSVIELCWDKYELTEHLRARGLPVPATYPLTHLADVDAVVDRLGRPRRLWCRIRTGNGSMGALPIAGAGQAKAWIQYWEEMRRVPAQAFTISEYLPGRDFACQTLWQSGRLVLVKTVERLTYFGGTARASGVSSVAALATTVIDPRLVDICHAAVRALDDQATGAFSIDLKEDASGAPCITEINAGRFITMMNFFDFTGRHNMALTYARLALNEPVQIEEPYDAVADYYFVRDVDTLPAIFHADELFEGVRDGRG